MTGGDDYTAGLVSSFFSFLFPFEEAGEEVGEEAGEVEEGGGEEEGSTTPVRDNYLMNMNCIYIKHSLRTP